MQVVIELMVVPEKLGILKVLVPHRAPPLVDGRVFERETRPIARRYPPMMLASVRYFGRTAVQRP